jgi:hypothetical protein
MEMSTEIVAVEMELTQEQMEELEEAAKQLEEKKQNLLSGLASGIQSKYMDRSARRQTKERQWIESIRLYLGSLSIGGRTETNKDYPFTENTGSNKPIHNLVRTKCDVAVATSHSAQFAGGEKNWDIKPTSSPEGDPLLVEEAAVNMSKEINDQLVEENYAYKSRQAMWDRVVLGTGILKGPLAARDAKLSYILEQDPVTGETVPIPDYKVRNRPILSRVDPWMFFPDDTVSSIKDAQDCIELHPMNKPQLAKLKKNPGFFSEAIDSLLQLEPQSYANNTFSEYSTLTDSGTNFLRDKYAVLEYHGPISVDELGALGIEPSYDPLGDVYYGEVWVCQGVVLRAELETISGLYQLPYKACAWEIDPNSIFGFSLPQCIKDPQRIAQVTLDMILENASISSGPIAIINKSFIEPFDGDWTLYPNKLFGTTDYTLASVDQAMKFINVPNNSGNLFPILQFAREVAQEESAMPLLAGGLQSPQVGSDSATGLAILQQNMTTVSDYKNEQWDDMIVEPLIEQMYHWNMQFNPRPDIVGDFDIDVRSSSEYRNKQLFVRDIEKLSVEAAQNPALAKVINMDALQRARLSMMHIPSDTIIKSQEQIAQEEQEAAQNPPPPDPAMLKAQAEMAKIEVDKMRLQMEGQKLQFEMSFQQRREEMDHAERMGATYARHLEAEARVQEAMANREVELLKLAQKETSDNSWIMAELQKSQLTNEANKFMAGLETQSKFREQALKAAELDYAWTHKKGI